MKILIKITDLKIQNKNNLTCYVYNKGDQNLEAVKSFFILDQTLKYFENKIKKLELDIKGAKSLTKKNLQLKRKDIAKHHFYWKVKLEKVLLKIEKKRLLILQAKMQLEES